MGIKLARQKKRHLLLSIIYKLKYLLPLSKKRKFKLFLDLEWIFDRLAHEESFKLYSTENHPYRIHSKHFILENITHEHKVLDLGCRYGEMSNFIAEKAKSVIGIDHDKKAIEAANVLFQRDNLAFENREAYEYLSAQDETFDVLILSHILEHLDEPKEFLLKFKSFFDIIYIEVPDFDRYYLNQYRLDHGNDLIYSDNDHVSEFDRHELHELVENAGLIIQKSEYRFGVQKLWCQVTKAD